MYDNLDSRKDVLGVDSRSVIMEVDSCYRMCNNSSSESRSP